MRKELFGGLVLAAATLLLVLIGEWLDLELTPALLVGLTAGAVAGLVPDRSAAARVGGLAIGAVVSLVGYVVRTSPLPDAASGRAVTFTLVILVLLGIALVARGRVPFWALLLGAGAFAGAYEGKYDIAPPLVLDTSISALTSLLLTVAVGFLAVSWFGPEHEESETVVRNERDGGVDLSKPRTHRDDDSVALDSMMDKTR